MNRKGFTLVELLAVIIILSLIIVVVSTNGLGAFNNTKNAITDQNKKTIEEAARVYLTDVIYCEDNEYLELKSVLKDENISIESCIILKEYFYKDPNSSESYPNKYIKFSELKNKGYISGGDLEDTSIYNDTKIKITVGIDNNNNNKIDVKI